LISNIRHVLRTKRLWLNALRVAGVVLAALLVCRVFAAANGGRVVDLVTSIGAGGALLVVCPQLAALGFESLGWRHAFSVAGTAPRFFSLLRVRLSTEALAQSLPVGVAFAESMKPLLLGKHCGIGLEESVAGMAARKVLLLAGQCLYVGGLGLIGFRGLQAASRSVIGAPHLGWLTLGSALVLGMIGVASASLLRRSAIARSALALFERVPVASVQRWLAARRGWFAATDGAVSALFGARPHRFALSLVFFTLGWFVESVETWLILSVLGAPTSFATVGSLEVVVSLVRNVVFVVPAGLGVQDLGYATCFAAFGVPEAESVGAAFVLLKRGKELFWIAVGYALLGGDFAALSRGGTLVERQVSRLRHAT
jgi:hypothetical protein